MKVSQARIVELQNSLRESSGGSHPLLQEDPLEAPNELDSYADVPGEISDTMGSLLIGPDGNAKYHGESAGSEMRLDQFQIHTFI